MHSFYECIPENFLMPKEQLAIAQKIIAWIGYYGQTGRPPINDENVIQALYYISRTGIQWDALPKCFGPSSTIHEAFQRLCDLEFFDNFLLESLDMYNQKIGLDLNKKVGDCSHVKSPLGINEVGPSPVDRRKHGTKRSIITDGNGIMLGCALGPGNRNDTQLLEATLESIPTQYRSPGNHQLWLDAIYDTEPVKTMCFAHNLRPRISPHSRRKRAEPVRPVPKGVRWVVERTHSWMNRFRRVFVRYDKSTESYMAFAKLAVISTIFKRLRVSG